MAFEFGDSFDTYTTNAETTKKWTSVEGSTILPLAGAGRNGTSALRNTESVDYHITKTLTAQATRIIGLALKLNAAPTGSFFFGVEFRDVATAQVGFYINSDSTISVKRGGSGGTVLATSTNSLSTGVFYYIEFKATINNSGTYEVRVNGVSTGWIPSASGDTQQTANATADVIAIRLMRSNQSYVDDFYSCNNSGSKNNNFLGDIRIAAIFPDAAGTYSEWVPTSGANYTCVDETTPNDDADYVTTSGVGYRDTYNFQSLPVASGSILALQTIPYARKDDAGSRFISSLIYYNLTLYSGASSSIGDTYNFYPTIFEVNPDTNNDWTVSEVNNAEFGEKLEA